MLFGEVLVSLSLALQVAIVPVSLYLLLREGQTVVRLPFFLMMLALLIHHVFFFHQHVIENRNLTPEDWIDISLPFIAAAILVGVATHRLQLLNRFEEAIKKREALYRAMFERNLAVQLLIDPTTGSIVDANPAAEQFYGYPRETLKTMNINQINMLPPEKIREEMQKAVRENRNRFFFPHRLASGEIREVEVTAAPIEVEGRRLLYSIVHDITEQRKAEEETRHLIRELDAFAYTVAHDLKAPLSIIIGYAQLLREDTASPFLLNIEATAKKMGRIIDELLLFARTYEKEKISYEVLDMRSIVEEVQQRLLPLIEAGSAEITFAEDWPKAVGHTAWVEEVWMNYLSNALKYGGVRPRIVMGADVSDGGMVSFWVKDAGEGLNPEQQMSLFKPFQRLHPGHPNSTGLGLWIVRRLIERQGGKVGVISKPGDGCIFYFTLPAASPDAIPAVTATPQP